jgi:hypothetical protein
VKKEGGVGQSLSYPSAGTSALSCENHQQPNDIGATKWVSLNGLIENVFRYFPFQLGLRGVPNYAVRTMSGCVYYHWKSSWRITHQGFRDSSSVSQSFSDTWHTRTKPHHPLLLSCVSAISYLLEGATVIIENSW